MYKIYHRVTNELIFKGSDLEYANLRSANLWGATLRGANLVGADLGGADLRSANLVDVSLRGANLRSANLWGAHLRGANLVDANLEGANLEGVSLVGVSLVDANLEGATLPKFSILPEGRIIGWKSARAARGEVILKLGIESANRTNSLVGRKCRTDEVVLLEIYCATTGELLPKNIMCYSEYDPYFAYIYCPKHTPIKSSYDGDIRVECTKGIHFWITVGEALSWVGKGDTEVERRILNGGEK